jgi:hypothetical protein
LLEVALRLASVVAAVVEIAFRDDTKSTGGGEPPGVGAGDLVHANAV